MKSDAKNVVEVIFKLTLSAPFQFKLVFFLLRVRNSILHPRLKNKYSILVHFR